ncbi:hypothetical protein DPMN_009057 [Dreissena polymorpha]|uniref:Uncharacterized protein n=1 Tax=Dreissena polymorpha TaxID=45954 RepID=A0A9D4N0H0_DREPO|nr:hypothetical protein DPMN_009057 [Dreissena polymorpha]
MLHLDTERRIQTLEHTRLRISYLEKNTNANIRNMTATLVGPHEPLLATVKRVKPAWFGHQA